MLGEDGTEFVWWDTSDTKEELTASVYRLEHRIDVSISTENSRASAQVSLFDTVKFAVSFGPVAALQSKTVIIQIDPEADLPPRDITVTTIAGRDLAITQPDFSSDELRSFTEKGSAQKAFGKLFSKVADVNLQRVTCKVLDEVTAAACFTGYTRRQKVKDALSKQGQQILNFLAFSLADLKSFVAGEATLSFLEPALNCLNVENGDSSGQISQMTNALLEIAKEALAQEILTLLEAGSVSQEQLAMLLGGGSGSAIICRAILDPILERLLADVPI